jgi:molybdate transport system substrate-binding protein
MRTICRALRCGLFSLALAGLSLSVTAAELRVAVASNFAAPMRALVADFEAQTGHRVQLSLGSSGKLYAQVVNGAPFDVFFSADQHKPLALEQRQLAVDGSRFTYATGALALWSRADTPGALEQLERGEFSRLALANQRLAPYGAAAVQTLESLSLTSATQSKWVVGENIAQTFQFIHSGNAGLGFVARSQLAAVPAGANVWLVPESLHVPINQDAMILRRTQNPQESAALLAYIASAEARDVITAHGYSVPEASP